MHMKKKISILAIGLAMVSVVLPSCSWEIGKGDLRDRNLEKATLSYLACEDEVEYVGLSDPHDLEDNKFQVVVIYYYTDSLGSMIFWFISVIIDRQDFGQKRLMPTRLFRL